MNCELFEATMNLTVVEGAVNVNVCVLSVQLCVLLAVCYFI